MGNSFHFSTITQFLSFNFTTHNSNALFCVQQSVGILPLVFLVMALVVMTVDGQGSYVDKWEPFDIKNNPQVDVYESSYSQFGPPSKPLVGTIYEYIARPGARLQRINAYKTFYKFY